VTGQTLVGRTGSVTTRVRGGDLPGEVKVVVAGLPHYYVAYCSQPVPAGATVLVIHSRGARQIDVEPWDGHTSTITTDRT
jgi:membrane protein implicated in regulation of membrane protease activity